MGQMTKMSQQKYKFRIKKIRSHDVNPAYCMNHGNVFNLTSKKIPSRPLDDSERVGGNLTPRTFGAIDALLGADRNRLKYLLSKPYRGQLTHFLARELKIILTTDGLWTVVKTIDDKQLKN